MTELQDVVLNVNDRVEVGIKLSLEGIGDNITVTAESWRARTSPAVGTVVDRQFVENLPLNGRSLQALLTLTPGVVMTRATNPGEGGQFSVNGQRTNANYFMIDGTSANAGIASTFSASPGQGGSGQLPALTALGTTNGLISVDALQEFKIQTSTYAPEFGRTPGGQISMVSRSGTNSLRGSVFEYFRDDALDATDWFANYRGQPKAELSQHNFGGVVGGPIIRNRTFFFASYEGLRLKQPQAKVIFVPSMQTRATATPAVRALLDALPIPTGAATGAAAEFAASYSDSSRIDTTSVKVDHAIGSHNLFVRGSNAPSYSRARSGPLSYVTTTQQNANSITGGATWVIRGNLLHDVRANYSATDAPYFQQPDSFGGAAPPPVDLLFALGQSPADNFVQAQVVTGSALAWGWGAGAGYKQRQFNIVDSITLISALHEFKFGVDYRRMNPMLNRPGSTVTTLVFGVTGLSSGQVSYRSSQQILGRQAVAFDNVSLYAQDHWRMTPRMTLTYGVRWEFVPPPHSTEGLEAITLDGLNDLYGSGVKIAPEGTRLWTSRADNFGPRIGASYVLSQRPSMQLVLRGGWGLFHDLGFGHVAGAYRSHPFFRSKTVNPTSFPLRSDVQAPPAEASFDNLIVMDRNLALPYTSQWNVTAEQLLGKHQALTISYVGADGQRLLKQERYTVELLERPSPRTPVWINRNTAQSNYHALQLQFQRRLHDGLQALASYTYGQSRDTGSSDAVLSIPAESLTAEVDYGASDFDVRHVFSAALTYQLGPIERGPAMFRVGASNWGIDLMMRARSGFPLNVSVSVPFPPDNQTARPNVVPLQAFWVDDPAAPGGRRTNRAAFVAPPVGTQGNLVRGDVRGFSASQVDMAIRRTFKLLARVNLQVRCEMFNLLNTPNFSDPLGTITSSAFGLSSQMLSAGFGGLNSFYQMGGPRSTQLAVKIQF